MARLYIHKLRGWQIHFRIYFPDGADKVKYRYYRNKTKALRALQDIEQIELRSMKDALTREDLLYAVRANYISKEDAARITGGAPVEIPTLTELSETFLTDSRTENKASTHKVNKIRINHILKYFGEDLPVDQMTTDTIKAYRRHRLKSVSAATVNKEMIKIGQLMDEAMRLKAITGNPARSIKRLKDKTGRPPRSLTRKELKVLLEVSADHKSRKYIKGIADQIIKVYLYTGMRRSELLWLECEDIDIDRRQLTIQSKIDFKTKTGDYRTVSINPDIIPILKRRVEAEGPFVFGGRQPFMTPDGITHQFKKIVRAAGLPETITLHSLRHTYATHLLELGINPKVVQQRLGHRAFATTWRYMHALIPEKNPEDELHF